MTTTPNGTPAWTRAADHTYYGGHADKANYNGEPIVNPRTDVDASQIQRLASDMAAVARMATFANLEFASTGTSTPVWVRKCRLMTGSISASYAGTSPPAGFPTVTQIAAGVYVAELGKAYTDDYSVSAVFEPVFCGGNRMDATAYVKSYVSGTSLVYLEAYTNAGTTPVSTGTFSLWAS